jgi:cytochrome c-type biogenesis protein CcmF
VALAPGDTVSFDGYEISYQDPFTINEPNRTVIGARLMVERDDRTVTVLEPRLNQFANASSLIATPAVHTKLGGDLYVTLRTLPDPEITVTLDSSPLMWTVWLGGILTGAGGFVSARGRRRTRAKMGAASGA